jgi:protein-tyrosine-phosphatase
MAEAIARSLGGGRLVAESAGLAPAGFVADATIRVLAARGHDTAGLWSKGLEALDAEPFDVVVSLLGRRGVDLLPPALGHRFEAWDIRDPFGEDETIYQQVAREIEARVRLLVDRELGGELLRP